MHARTDMRAGDESTSFLGRANMLHRALLFFGFLVSNSAAFVLAFDGPAGNFSQGYVLLQNGNVLKGRIQVLKNSVTVAIDGNSTLSLDPKQVEHVGSSLESLYQHQRAGVRVWGTGEHWHLAHWCIQQELLDHAIKHFQALESNAADSPRFKQLEHLLREALIKHNQGKQGSTSSTSTNDKATSDIPQSENNQVVLASSIAAPTRTVSADDNANPSDGWATHEIPGYIRKTFQTSVLPILVSRCGQSGCHGMLGKSDFHLYQPLGDQASTILAKDLDEVLRYINRDRVQDSPLLAYATKAHGIQRNPSLNQAREDERAYIERINLWVKSLTLSQRQEPTMPSQYPLSVAPGNPNALPGVTQAVANLPVPTTQRASRSALRKPDEIQDRNAKLSKPAKSAPPTVFLSGSELADLETMIDQLEQKYKSGETAPPASKDPFDPDVFNKKFR
jgi:hypothetical protein